MKRDIRNVKVTVGVFLLTETGDVNTTDRCLILAEIKG